MLHGIAPFASQVIVGELRQLQSSAVVYRLFDALSSNRLVDDCRVFSDRVSDSVFVADFEEEPESDRELVCETLSEASDADSDRGFDLLLDLLFV